MEKNVKQSASDGNSSTQRVAEVGKSDLVVYDGEENVELVDSEWADFERALRYIDRLFFLLATFSFFFKFTDNNLIRFCAKLYDK